MFSQDHRGIHFIGKAKLAFAMAARSTKPAPVLGSGTVTPRGTFGVKRSSEDATFFHSHTRSVPHEVSRDPIQRSKHRRSRGAKVLPPDYSGTFGRYYSKTR